MTVSSSLHSNSSRNTHQNSMKRRRLKDVNSIIGNNINTHKSNDDMGYGSKNEAKKQLRKHFYTSDFQQRRYASSLYQEEDEPIYFILCKIGSTIVLLASVTCLVFFIQYLFSFDNPSPSPMKNSENKTTFPELHSGLTIDPTLFSMDVFGILQNHLTNQNSKHLRSKGIDNEADFWTIVKTLSENFANIYGGQEAARYLLQNGITLPEISKTNSSKKKRITSLSERSLSSRYSMVLHNLAKKILLAKEEQHRPFRIGFTGYDAITARGIHHRQSFTYFMEGILQEPLLNLLGIELEIRNVGMANISPFPYGWCLNEILSVNDNEEIHEKKMDVVMMDVSTSQNDENVEAFLRNIAVLYGNPIVIWRDDPLIDGKDAVLRRRVIFQSYIDQEIIPPSSFIFNALTESTVEPFLSLQPRPPGFQKWDMYNGTIATKTGKMGIFPSAQEHELMGWILSMHFLTALEIIAEQDPADRKNMINTAVQSGIPAMKERKLPPPLTRLSDPNSLSFGSPLSHSLSNMSSQWKMNQRYCYTSFTPPIHDDLNDYSSTTKNTELSSHLSNLIVSGIAAEDDVNKEKLKGHLDYRNGWVFNVASKDKQRYLFEKKFDYLDSKMGYFGSTLSGTLSLFLPWKQQYQNSNIVIEMNKNEKKLFAKSYFTSLMVCGINDRYHEIDACEMMTDIRFHVSGIVSPNVKTMGIPEEGSEICVSIEIPEESALEFRKESNGQMKSSQLQIEKNFGLRLDIDILNLIQEKGPCSITNVIWEQTDNS